MTSPGRHAATDGSFSKSAGSALFRGGGLVALAVLIGLILLYWVYDDDNQGGYTVGAGSGAAAADANDDGDNNEDDGVPAGDDENVDNSIPVEDEPTTTTPTSLPVEDVGDDDGTDGSRQPPEETVALAVNGVGTKGLAGKLESELITLNFKTGAANLSGNASETLIYFKPNYKGNARDIADALGWSPSVIKKFPDDGSIVLSNDNARVDDANIIVVIGSDGTFQ